MRQDGSKRTRRPVVVFVCSFLRVERRVRAACSPYVRSVARVVVRIIAGEGDEAITLTTHIVVAAASSAAFGIVAACTGVGPAELCQLASALVVGALAARGACALVRRRMSVADRQELRALLAATARLLLADNARLPAARVLRVVLGPRLSPAQASVGVALAALAPPLDMASLGTLLRLALRPASRMVPAMGLALDVHGTYRDCRDNARFVRDFALTAAALCPAPGALPALCA